MRTVAVVAAIACVWATACAAPPEPPRVINAPASVEPGQTVDLEPQESGGTGSETGTGETLEGAFTAGGAAIALSADGSFTRVAGGRTEAGTYLITADGRVVLFVEQIGDQRLTTVRKEVVAREALVPAG